MILLLLLSLAMAKVTPEEEYKITCRIVCQQDGENKYWIDSDGCNCGNPRPIGKVPLKIPRTYNSTAVTKPLYYYSE